MHASYLEMCINIFMYTSYLDMYKLCNYLEMLIKVALFPQVESQGNTRHLVISESLRNDSGTYECQINTRPKLSWAVKLDVMGEIYIY